MSNTASVTTLSTLRQRNLIDRAKRATPVFMPVMPMTGEPANQLMIADPGMEGTGECTLAWYTGYDGFNAQDALLDIIRRTLQSAVCLVWGVLWQRRISC